MLNREFIKNNIETDMVDDVRIIEEVSKVKPAHFIRNLILICSGVFVAVVICANIFIYRTWNGSNRFYTMGFPLREEELTKEMAIEKVYKHYKKTMSDFAKKNYFVILDYGLDDKIKYINIDDYCDGEMELEILIEYHGIRQSFLLHIWFSFNKYYYADEGCTISIINPAPAYGETALYDDLRIYEYEGRILFHLGSLYSYLEYLERNDFDFDEWTEWEYIGGYWNNGEYISGHWNKREDEE